MATSSDDIVVRQDHADEAKVILGKLAAAIRDGAPSRFHVKVKPILDELWELAKFVADHED